MVVIGRLYPEVIKICRPLIVEDDVLKLLTKKFAELIGKSLTRDNAHESMIRCNQTFIADFPDGTERGSAIGLDISGKVFRLVHVTFCGDRIYNVSSRLYEVPESKLAGSGFKVVDYVARCVANFIETSDVRTDAKIVLGVSIGFPIRQDSLQNARLLRWTDDFRCEDMINEDFFMQLKLALKKYKSSKNVFLIGATNEAAAIFLAGLYKDPSSCVGLSIGNQINLCYMEKQDNITLFDGDGLRSRTVVQMDFRNFGDDGALDFIRTEFDHELDAASEDQGRRTMDKLTSAHHLGELFRLCLLRLVQEKHVLDGVVRPKLKNPGVLKGQHIADIESESEKTYVRCRVMLLHQLGYSDVTDSDCCQIRFVARCLARRSANLVAAFLSAVITRLDVREIRVSVDGSYARQYAKYKAYMEKKVQKLKRPDAKTIITMNDKEDLGVGAGLLAHIYKDGVIRVEEKYRVLPPLRPDETVRLVPPGMPCRDCHSPDAGKTVVQICP